MSKVDLHLHTNLSDGLISPEDVVIKAKNNDCKIISITDHELLNEYDALAKKYNIDIISGIEFNTSISNLHLLGYAVKNFKLVDEEMRNLRIKNERVCLEVVELLKKDGFVMMRGDGINDSVSLVTADIGVSISSGTDIAMDSSNIVLMNDNLDKINELIKISKRTITNIKQNLFWAFFYNICMIPIACGIFKSFNIVLNPMLAALAMTISSLTVVLNALRLKRIKN